MRALLQFLRRIVPAPAIDRYHRLLSRAAAVWYGHPSEEMIVIGVTGTSGKTTTCYLLSKLLESDGAKTGMTSTAFFKVADRTWENRTKMTTLGRFQLQRLLRDMADAGCRYAIVETTSQGIAQHRHEHIAYDALVFTNLWPEHIEAHGGFEQYKRAKIRLFEYAAELPRKTLNGVTIPRVEILNMDNEHARDFIVEGLDRVAWPQVTDVQLDAEGIVFSLDGVHVTSRLTGRANVENARMALVTARALGVPLPNAVRALASVPGLPGRYEKIEEGQPFTMIIDYAFEPVAMEKLYEAVRDIPHRRVIHVLGSCGGGRDVARRPVLGRLAGTEADIVIVTDEDPYDDDPRQIMEDVARGAREAGKSDGNSLLIVEDRGDAIRKAVSLAQPQDIVLITGKGSEPLMVVAGGRKIPWSDAGEARKALKGLLTS